MPSASQIVSPDTTYFITLVLPSRHHVFTWLRRDADVSTLFAFAKACVTGCKTVKLTNLNCNELIENRGKIGDAVKAREGRTLDSRYVIGVRKS
jgi:hypothetical protein